MKLLATSLTLAFLLVASVQGQNTLYQHNFSGLAATPLHRLAADVDNNGGANAWTTRTDNGLPSGTGREWYADGHSDVTLEPGVNGAATLGFAPVAGNIYTFTVRVASVAISGGNIDNWLGVGFSAGQATGSGGNAEFFGTGLPDQITGNPWMLYRAAGSGAPDQTFLGPSVFAGQDWPAPITAAHGDPVDLRIVLNTTASQWSVEWLAKRTVDPSYTSIRTTSYALNANPNIRAIALATNENIAAVIDTVTLTTSGSIFSAGDTEGDGAADVDDFNTIRNNFFNPVLGPQNGDLNNDGIVNYVDFRVWKTNASLAVLAAVGIPEPSSVVLGCLGLAAVAGIRRRRLTL